GALAEPPIGPVFPALQGIASDLGLVRSIGDELRLQQPELFANFHDRAELMWLINIDGSCSLAHAFSGVGLIRADRGLATSNSVTTALATSSGEPARSWASPQRQPSR